MLVGERASGLGGAYTAISDDPSGIYHNPAGIVFSLENYLSLSANGFTSGSTTYENVYPGQNYIYRSNDFVPVFFGFIQSWGKAKWGFAVIVPRSDNVDQADTITRTPPGPDSAESFTRKFLRQDLTYEIGPAYAMELADNFSIGFSLMGYMQDVKAIDNTTVLYPPAGTGKYFWQMVNVNKKTYAITPKIGIQYMPNPRTSLGFTISRLFNLGGVGTARITKTKVNAGTNTPVTPSGTFNQDIDVQDVGNLAFAAPTPVDISLGYAYFPNRAFLATVQLDWHSGQAGFADFPIRAVLDWSLGAEYHFFDWIAARAAIFSNNSRTYAIDTTKTNQQPHVNLFGTSLGVSFQRSGSSFTLGAAYMFGSGQGQAFADTVSVQTVRQNRLSVYISGSYQL